MNTIIFIVVAVITFFSLLLFYIGKFSRRLAWRNIFRRKANTVLVTFGAMVGTAIIMGSFAISDTFNRLNLDQVYKNLGEIDFVLSGAPKSEIGSTDVQKTDPQEIPTDFYSQNFFIKNDVLNQIISEIPSSQFDGVLPITVVTTPSSNFDESLQRYTLSEAGSNIITFDFSKLKEFGQDDPGNISSIIDLTDEQVVITKTLAHRLELNEGDKISIYVESLRKEYRIKKIIELDGMSGMSGGLNIYMTYNDFKSAYQLKDTDLGLKKYNQLLISANGDKLKSDKHYQQDLDKLNSILQSIQDTDDDGAVSSVIIFPMKHEVVSSANDRLIAVFFIAVSGFAMLSGVLLIINIFSLLAEERKRELGIMRALGLTRFGLISVFVKEGMLYSLTASLVGILVGIGLGYFVIQGFSGAMAQIQNLGVDADELPEFRYSITTASVVYSLIGGYLLTFITVIISSIRISRLNIIAAIRDLDESKKIKRSIIKTILKIILLLIVSIILWFLYKSTDNQIKGCAILLSAILDGVIFYWIIVGLHIRILNSNILGSIISVGSIGWAIFALKKIDAVSSANKDGSVAILGIFALTLVVGSIIFVINNFNLITWLLVKSIGRIPIFKSTIKIATKYPSLNKSSTGMTIAMFSFVLFLVVAVTVITGIYTKQYRAESDKAFGGFDGLVYFPSGNDVDFDKRVENSTFINKNVFEGRSYKMFNAYTEFIFKDVQYDEKLPGDDNAFTTQITLIDDKFAEKYNIVLASRDQQFGSDKDALIAAANNSDYIILGSQFSRSGDYFPWPIMKAGDTLEIKDGEGNIVKKKVIGVEASTSEGMTINVFGGGIMSSKNTDKLKIDSSMYAFNLFDDTDEAQLQKDLQKEFNVNQIEIFLVKLSLDTIFGILDSFISIFKSFLAFGLIVGIAGLAVIAYRTVHQRRQQIGMMRAIGYEQKHILLAFLLEFSYIAFLGILVGVGMGTLGMWIAFPVDQNLKFVVPWNDIVNLSLLVYLASLIFVILPAVSASRLKPVEALRYES